MLKLIIVGRRRPGSTRLQAQGHLKTVHGRMVVSPPEDAGAMPVDYCQNHVFDGAYPSGEAVSAAHAMERDLVTELWFESPQHLGAATATPYYKNSLNPDEGNFVDRATVAAAPYEATPRHNPDAGPFKLFVVLNPAQGVSAADLTTTVRTASADIASLPSVQDFVCNTPMPRPGVTPFAAVMLEFWFASKTEAYAFAETEVARLYARFPPQTLDPAACAHILAEEFPTARLKAEHAAL